MIRVADYISSYLVNLGVPDIFTVAGGGIMYILDGLRCNRNINWICAHNEAAAAVMAEGYARASNNIGALLVTTGPGGTNAVTGVVDAWVDSIPLLVISGQSKRSQNVYNSGLPKLRTLGGQEVNILPIVQSFTKYSAMVNEPEMIRYHLDKAVYCAKSGRPGPSWLDIPLDVQAAVIDPDELEPFLPSQIAPGDGDLIDKQVAEVYQLLKQSQRPVIIAGNGVRLSGAEGAFVRLIDSLKVPVVVSKLGQDLMDHQHPYFVGFGGTKGTRAANFAMQNSDLIISIGSRLAIPFIGYEYDLFAREAKKISVDIDPSEMKKKTIKLDMAINADAYLFIEKMLAIAEDDLLIEKSEWIKKCRHWKEKYNVITEEIRRHTEPVSSYNLFDRLSEMLDKKSVIIADAGTVYCIISQAFRVKYGQRIIVPAALGTMGLSLPLSIGAYYAARDSKVVAVTGDGSLQMNIQELQTVVHNRIPIKLFVVNNNGYLSIRNTQNAYFEGRFIGSDPGSGVSCPDLMKIAYAYGIKYESIHSQRELENKLKGIIDYEGPIVCEVFADPNQQIMPSVSSKVLASGRMVSMPLEDMWPYLPREELEEEMIIRPIDYEKLDE